MASSQEAISRLTIQSTLTGEAEVTAGLKRISAAQDGVAVSSSSSDKTTVSLEKSFANIERRYVAGVAAQQQYEKIQRQVNAAVQQNPALQERANTVLAAAAQRLSAVTNAAGIVEKDIGKVGQVMGVVESRALGLNASMGMVGAVLQIIGPAGIAVGAVLGAIAATMAIASTQAHELAQKAKEIREFSEATGLTTTQFQALRSEAGKFGIDSETLSAGLSKFTAGFESLRLGNGQLLTDIRKINPALADQMQQTTDAATAFTLFGKAVEQTDNIFQRNALLKAGLGRGSAIFGAFFESSPNVAAITSAFEAAGKGIDKSLVQKLAQTQIEIDKTRNAAATVFASIFSESTLRHELEFQQGLLTIATTIKSFALSDDLKRLIDFLTNPVTLAALAALAAAGAVATGLTVGGVALGVGAAGLVAGGVVSGVSRIGANDNERSRIAAASPTNFVSPANSYSTFQRIAQPVEKTPEAQATDLKNLVSVLGSAASPAQKLSAAIAELGIRAKEAGVGEDVLAKGVAALKFDDAIARQNAHNAALGQSATVTDLVAAKTLELKKAQEQGAGLTAAQVANQIKLTETQALGTFQIDAQAAAEKVKISTLFMSSEAATSYALVQTKINEAVALGKPLTEDQIRNLQKSADAFAKVKAQGDLYTELLNTAKQSGAQFTGDLISGLGQGQKAVEALHGAFKNLASTLTSSALKSLFEGDFISAGIKGIAAAAAAIFSANTNSSGDKWLQGQIEGMNARAAEIAQRQAAIGVDTNTRQGAILAQDAEFTQQRLAENKAGGQDMQQLLQIQVQERNQLLADWDKKDTELLQANADAKLAIEKAAADRSLGFQNRLFAAANDNATLEGQLAAFDRAAQQERAQEVQAGGQAIVDLEAAQAAERLNVIQKYNDQITESAKAAAKAQLDALNGTAKSVVDYLNNLISGPGATSSPTATLSSAQSVYNSNLALAIGGNTDAQNKFPQLADNLEKAARAVYASSQQYQNIKNQIISQGLALPAVQNATDPVVVAIRDTISAINAAAQTQALDATLQGVIKAAIDAGNAQQVAAALLPTMGNQLTFAQFVDKVAPLAKDTTAASLLTSSQVSALGLSTNATVAQLLTSAQLISAVGPLSKDTTVGTLLNASQLVQAVGPLSRDTTVGTLLNASQLASNLGPLAKETTLGTLPNYNQFQSLGLSKDTTVGTLLNLSQLTGLGLSTDTKVGTLLNLSQLTGLGLAANATVGNVQSAIDSMNAGNILRIFQELDGNGDGILEKSEAIAQATGVTKSNTDATVYLDTLTYSNARSTDFNTASSALQATISNQLLENSNAQLVLLTKALSPVNPNAFSVGTKPSDIRDINDHVISQATVQNQVVDALNKIVVNTFAAAQNLYLLVSGMTNLSGLTLRGMLAGGGWITGGTPGVDSVPILAMQDEFMVNRNATRALTQQFGSGVMDIINSGRLPFNDNGRPLNVVAPVFRGGVSSNAELVAEVRALRKEVEQLRKENNSGNVAMTNTIAQTTYEAGEKGAQATRISGAELRAEMRLRKRDQRAA